VIPFKGAWMEFATDINNVMYAYIDRKKKFPVTTLLRSIGFETDKDILELFGMADEVKGNKKTWQNTWVAPGRPCAEKLGGRFRG
jgi:DNA-directed RNA polymerase subunit beta